MWYMCDCSVYACTYLFFLHSAILQLLHQKWYVKILLLIEELHVLIDCAAILQAATICWMQDCPTWIQARRRARNG